MRSLADLTFEPAEPLALLGLAAGEAADPDRFGWCRPPGVELCGEGQTLRIDGPLVLALHCPDEDAIPVPLRGGVPADINLEFVLGGDDSAVALLSEFLRARVPAIVGDARAIVLALCNPRRARISRPPELAGRRIYYGAGEVVAWLRGQDRISLECERWYSC